MILSLRSQRSGEKQSISTERGKCLQIQVLIDRRGLLRPLRGLAKTTFAVPLWENFVPLLFTLLASLWV